MKIYKDSEVLTGQMHSKGQFNLARLLTYLVHLNRKFGVTVCYVEDRSRNVSYHDSSSQESYGRHLLCLPKAYRVPEVASAE